MKKHAFYIDDSLEEGFQRAFSLPERCLLSSFGLCQIFTSSLLWVNVITLMSVESNVYTNRIHSVIQSKNSVL